MINSGTYIKSRKICIQLLCSIILFHLFSFQYLTLSAQIYFSDLTNHPVLSYGQSGEWDDAVVWNPAVVKDGDTLRMWYTGHNESIWTESTTGNIGFAWSVDGYTWNKPFSNPVLKDDLDWEGGKLFGCAVIKDGNTLKMWYGAEWIRTPASHDISVSRKIGYAESFDGITWFKQAEPVMETGLGSDWDSDYIVPHTVIKVGNEYKMWFWAGRPGFPTKVESFPQIGLATSPDGINWTKYDNPATTEAPYSNSDPVLLVGPATDWDAHRVIDPIVLLTNSGYEMWYTGLKGPITANTEQKIGYATSTDGITWDKWPDNPILEDSFKWGKGIYGGTVLKFDESYHFWFACFHTPPTQARPQIGYAKSFTPVNIPDNAFLNALIAEGVDSDNNKVISYEEAESVRILDLHNKGISDLTGIEAFINLDTLICRDNNLTKLDVTGNTALLYLDVDGNNLDSLDVTNNSALTYLDCSSNPINSLDVSNNHLLKELKCGYNKLSTLDISGNINLERLECDINNLSNLDVSSNPKLSNLRCEDNNLSNLNVSSNKELKSLTCSFNDLTTIDISSNTELISLSCEENQITHLDISRNDSLKGLNCSFNQLSNLNVSENTELEELCCGNNQLTYIDVSSNSNLKKLYCSNNLLTSIVLGNIPLELLECNENQLTEMNVSGIEKLRELFCNDNALLYLDVSQNPSLGVLECENNQLTELIVSNNPSLGVLVCGGNQLTTLDLSKNELRGFEAIYWPVLNIMNMPGLYEVCVWTKPFPPDYLFFDSEGSPNVCLLTDCNGVCDPNVGIVKFRLHEVTIYPNPLNSQLTIETGIPDMYNININSINGQLLLNKLMAGTETQVDLSPLQSGVYFITVRSKDYVTTRKIIKL